MVPDYSKIRSSIHYYTYIDHSLSLKLAADSNLYLFIQNQRKPTLSYREHLEDSGFFLSTLLLYAVSVELIFKARGLYEERDNILNGSISSFNDFLNKFKSNGNGHNISELIKFYKIEISNSEEKIIKILQNFSVWAGRFPYPKKEAEIKKLEQNFKSPGTLDPEYKNLIENLIKKQVITMQIDYEQFYS